MAEEIKAAKGFDYSVKADLNMSEEGRQSLLALNPMGQVPVIEEDGFVLSESMAINLYLAKKHDVLSPKSLEQEANAWQWSFWVMTQVEADALGVLKYTLGLLGESKDDQKVAELLDNLDRPLAVLEGKVDVNTYLAGQDFGVVDLNVASVIQWLVSAGVDVESKYPNIFAWLKNCSFRPAAEAARKN